MSLANAPLAQIATIAVEFFKRQEDNTMRERILWAWMKRAGRIKYGASGHDNRFPIKFDLPTTQEYTGGALDFEPADKSRQFIFDWVTRKATDTMKEDEWLKASGPSLIVDRYCDALPDLIESLTIHMDTAVFQDVDGGDNNYAGLASFEADDSNTVVADIVAANSDTYLGRSTAHAAEGGQWSSDLATPPNATLATDWPGGSGTPSYDYIAAKLMNWGSSTWTGNAGDWAANSLAVIRRTLIYMKLLGSRKSNLLLLPPDMYDDALSAHDSKFRVNVPHRTANDLGFTGDGVNYDGLWITTEFGAPSNIGHMLNIDAMTYRVLRRKKLWATEGPIWDTKLQAFLFVAGGTGNFTFNPKHFARLANYADS